MTKYIIMIDELCPVHDGEHSEAANHRFFGKTNKGTACMECIYANCLEKMCPKQIIRKSFVVNNNNVNSNNSINVVYNNYDKKSFFT
jgi:hypothetical protein